jgi:hypothetical protein
LIDETGTGSDLPLNHLIKQFVNQKINGLTAGELEQLARRYGVFFNNRQAEAIIAVLRRQPVDIFSEGERKAILGQIAATTDPGLAGELEKLFQRFLRWANRQ